MVNPKLDSLYQRLPAPLQSYRDLTVTLAIILLFSTPLRACGWSRWNQWPPNGGDWIWCVRAADLVIIPFLWHPEIQEILFCTRVERTLTCRLVAALCYGLRKISEMNLSPHLWWFTYVQVG